MTLRSRENTATVPIAMPTSQHSRLAALEVARAVRVEALHAAARERHEARCRDLRARLLDSRIGLEGYHVGIAANLTHLISDLADVPLAFDTDLMQARVEARALDAIDSWWRDEIDAVQRALHQWTPNGVDNGRPQP